MSAVNSLPSSETPADKRAYEPSMEEILASIRRIIADDQSLPGRSAVPEALSPSQRPPRHDAVEPMAAAPTSMPIPALRADRPHVAPPKSAPLFAPTPEPAPAVAEAPREAAVSHGSIAPQFATPQGPVSDDHVQRQEPAALHEASISAPSPDVARAPAMRPESVVSPEPLPPEPLPPEEPAASAEDDSLYDTPIQSVPAREGPRDNSVLFSAATDTAVSSAFNMLAASRLADNSDELMTLAREMILPLLRTWIDDNMPGMVERMIRAEIERVARGGR